MEKVRTGEIVTEKERENGNGRKEPKIRLKVETGEKGGRGE